MFFLVFEQESVEEEALHKFEPVVQRIEPAAQHIEQADQHNNIEPELRLVLEQEHRHSSIVVLQCFAK